MLRTKGVPVVDSSLQLSIFAQTQVMASPFKLPSHCKSCSPTPFLKLIWANGDQGSTLAFRPLCSVLPRPVISMSPSRVKRRKKLIVSSQSNRSSLDPTFGHFLTILKETSLQDVTVAKSREIFAAIAITGKIVQGYCVQ